MTRLSVNINKIATIRNARGGVLPDLVKVAKDCESFGAQGITVHPRPDERHIRFNDVYELNDVLTTEFNIEGYPTKKFLKLISEIKPNQCTLVPDKPDVLTSNEGWNTIENKLFLKDVITQIKESAKSRVTLFMGNDLNMIDVVKEVNADRIELYTGPYAENYLVNKESAIHDYQISAEHARDLGLGINAGHDLSLINLNYLIQEIPFINEVSIGHALICDALYYGLENSIQLYLRKLNTRF